MTVSFPYTVGIQQQQAQQQQCLFISQLSLLPPWLLTLFIFKRKKSCVDLQK
jgi:hypothetical protein